jgi:predicted acetyltransferase
MSEIRVITKDEYPEMMRIIGEAYPSEDIQTRAARKEAIRRFEQIIGAGNWTPYAVYRDGMMVGVFRNFDFEMNVRGNMLKAGGLGMVAVHLAHKKAHVAKEIVESFLNNYGARGYAMTTLWPFRVDFYHRMGFGLGYKRSQYRVRPVDLPLGKTREHIRFLTEEDIPAINECYNRYVEQHNGMIKHEEVRWRHRLEYAEKLRFVGYETDGRLEGYLIYRFQPQKNPSNFMLSDMNVPEFVYHTPAALSEMLSFLHTQLDQIDRVTLEISEDEFYFLLANPVTDTVTRMAPTHHDSHIAAVGIMYRVMDVARLFEQLTVPSFGTDRLTVKITLSDTFYPSNHGSTVVKFADGLGRVVDGAEFDVEIELDVAEFSSMIMGAIGFGKLHTYGLARISDETYLERLDRLFVYRQKPTCITGF